MNQTDLVSVALGRGSRYPLRAPSLLRQFHASFLGCRPVATHPRDPLKKTMATAEVLDGITMQESGNSKQVTVRFEDWADEAQSEAA